MSKQAHPANSPRSVRRTPIVLAILAAVLVIATALAGCWWFFWRDTPATYRTDTFEYRLSADKKTVSLVSYLGSDAEVTLPATIGKRPVTAVEGLAFSWCKTVTSVTVPEGITSFGNGVFYNCTALTEVTLPASLAQWSDDPFMNCTALQAYHVAEGNPRYRATDGVLLSADGKTLVRYPAGRTDSSYTIPDTVTTIGARAFESAANLTMLTVPETVTTIGESAFNFCSGLMEIELPDTVTAIGGYAFSNCSSLLSVKLPAALTRLETATFSNCSALLTLTLPDGLVSIGDQALSTCLCLDELTLPKTVTSLGTGALMECTNLKSIVIPDGVTTLPQYLFGYCLALESVDIPDSVTTIDKQAFTACNESVVLTADESSVSFTFAAENGLDFRIRGTETVIDNALPETDE